MEKELKVTVDVKKPTNEELISLIKPLIPAIPKVVNGKDYVLTSEDKKEIANSIKVPIVEKVVEKIKIIKEQPIVIDANSIPIVVANVWATTGQPNIAQTFNIDTSTANNSNFFAFM